MIGKLAVGAAALYYLYGKNGVEHRDQIKGWLPGRGDVSKTVGDIKKRSGVGGTEFGTGNKFGGI